MPGLRSKATITGSLPLEAAIVKNADGSAVASPFYADCIYDAASGQWVCDTPAPDGTYQAGAQLMRLKGSNPAVTAGSLGPRTVAGNTPPAANQAPSVTIAGAGAGVVGTQQGFQAEASDADGTVTKVDLLLMGDASTLVNFTVLDTDVYAPYILNWTPTAAGNFTLRTRATDDKGAFTISSSSLTVVVSNSAPAAPSDLSVTSQRVASFTPASSKVASNYAYGLDGINYSELPSPSTVAGKITFTVPGSTPTQVYVRLKAAGSTPAGVAASANVLAYSTSGGSPVWMMMMGDSQSTNAFSVHYGRQIERQIDLVQFEYFDNRSIGGNRITDILSIIPDYIAAWNKAKYPQAIASFYLGVNNTIDGMSVADMLAQQDQAVTQLKAAGVKCIYTTFTPWRGTYDPAAAVPNQDSRALAIWSAFNQEMIANGVSKHGFDRVVDITKDPYIGGPNAPIDGAGTYFNSQDRLHLTTMGQAVLASYIYPVILDLAGTLTQPVQAADTVNFKLLLGMKQSYGIAVRDPANPTNTGMPAVTTAQGFGPTVTSDPDKNYYEMVLRKGQHTTGLFGIDTTTSFSNHDYYGLFAVNGTYFDENNDTFLPFEYGNYRAVAPMGYKDGDVMRWCNTPTETIVKLNGVEKFRVAKRDNGNNPTPNAPCSYFAVMRCPLKVGPITFHAEYPVANPY